jgi:hypothetical protein
MISHLMILFGHFNVKDNQYFDELKNRFFVLFAVIQ